MPDRIFSRRRISPKGHRTRQCRSQSLVGAETLVHNDLTVDHRRDLCAMEALHMQHPVPNTFLQIPLRASARACLAAGCYRIEALCLE